MGRERQRKWTIPWPASNFGCPRDLRLGKLITNSEEDFDIIDLCREIMFLPPTLQSGAQRRTEAHRKKQNIPLQTAVPDTHQQSRGHPRTRGSADTGFLFVPVF